MKQHVFFKYLTTIIVMMVVSLCFIQAYAFDSTVNLAVGKPAVARESRSFDGYGTNPAFVTDNSMITHWCAQWDGAGAGSWIYIDLQNYYMINKVVIDWRGGRWPNGAWKIQVATNEPNASGASNWVDVYTGSAGSNVTNGAGTYEFTATAGRFVRMLGIAQSTGYGYNIFEMRAFANDIATAQGTASSIAISPSSKTLMVNQQYQFQSSLIAANGIPMNVSYTPTWSIQESSGATINETTGLFRATQTGTYTINCNTTYESSPFNASATVTIIPFDASQNLALNKTATTSGAIASNGNDGSLSTRWRSSNANQKEWWQVDLGADYVVNNVNIKMNGDAGARGATYNILVSLTGLSDSWQTVVSTAQIPAGSGTEFNSHTIASVPARYIKYDGITRGGWDHNFAEFEVRGTGFYHAVAAAEFTSILFNNTNVIENEEVALTIAALDAENSPYLNATITGLEVTEGNTSGVTFEKRSNVWYARGVSEGTYTLTATGVDDENGSIVKTGTATLTVTEARRVSVINMSTPFAITKYAANRSIGLTLGCTDQYGAAINPTIIWDIQGTAGGSVTNNRYTPANKGTAVVRATSVTTAGTIQSSSITFDVITDAANVALNKSVTSISGATGGTSAVDGDEGSQWIVPHPGGRIYDAWLIIDLQAKYYIELVEVIWEGAYSKTFSVDYSNNGVDFTTKYNGTNTDPIVNKVNKFYTSPSSARYVRIRSTEAGTDYGTKILDVYIHGKSTTITTNSNSNLSTSDYTTDQLANSDLIISSNEIIVDQNTTINSIIVNPGAKLTLNSGQTLTAGTLRLESSSSGTGTFVDKNLSESTQAINATVQQYLPSGRNWYVSSPINTIAVPTGSTYFGYQEAGNNSDLSVSGATAYWKPYTAGASLTAGKGYIAQPLGETTLQFSGILNSGNTTVQLSRTALAAKAGFNLVGNPYPSYLDWSMVATANPNVLPTANEDNAGKRFKKYKVIGNY